MKKRLLSFALVLALCAALLPTIALAGEATIQGSGTDNDPWILTQESLEVYWDNGFNYYILTTGSYQLAEDLTIKHNICIGKYGETPQNVTFDLNGHVIKMLEPDPYEKTHPVFIVLSGKLTLKDSRPDTPHRFDTSKPLWTLAADDAQGEHIQTVYGGVLTGGNGSDAGGVVINAEQEFEMQGGNIIGCEGTNGAGGVRVSEKANFTMSGGSIQGCEGAVAGAVFVFEGTFTMTGGLIRNCTATMSGDGGCSIRNQETFNADGGEVYGKVMNAYDGNLQTAGDKKATVFHDEVETNGTATISGGIFRGAVKNGEHCEITGGVFYGDVTGSGAINGGVFFGTVTPSIVAQYNVTFDPCNGEDAQTGAVVGNKLFPPKAPTREGYSFDGWYKDEEEWDFAKDEIPEGTQEIKLQAKWKSEADGEGFVIAGGLLSGILEGAANALDETFADVSRGAYYYNAVQWAENCGIASGVDSKHFAPNESCTRAQAVTMLWRAAGCPEVWTENPFEDVSANDYYYEAVLWAVANGITSGADETHFSPDEPCTRGQIVTFLHRAEHCYDAHDDFGFVDVKTGSYCEDASNWAVENGITNGTDVSTFSPDETCTRAQIVTFLYRNR